MKITRAFIAFLLFSFTYAQQENKEKEEKSFPQAVKENIKRYHAISTRAYEIGDIEKGRQLFDTLVNKELIGTRFQDYSLKKFSGGKLKLGAIKKPILIQTYASWCVMNKGEIPALNKLARKYHKDLQIVVVFWDKRQNAKSIASQFGSNIEVCYANENYMRDGEVVATLKYSIGFLTSYYLDENLKVVDIKKGSPPPPPAKTPLKEAIKINYDLYNEGLANLILKSDIKKESIVKRR